VISHQLGAGGSKFASSLAVTRYIKCRHGFGSDLHNGCRLRASESISARVSVDASRGRSREVYFPVQILAAMKARLPRATDGTWLGREFLLEVGIVFPDATTVTLQTVHAVRLVVLATDEAAGINEPG
jgi:hypothetical protein